MSIPLNSKGIKKPSINVGGEVAFYCEECLNVVTPEEMHESELRYGGHIFCKNCIAKITHKGKKKDEDWI